MNLCEEVRTVQDHINPGDIFFSCKRSGVVAFISFHFILSLASHFGVWQEEPSTICRKLKRDLSLNSGEADHPLCR